jgi:hypothetical protein
MGRGSEYDDVNAHQQSPAAAWALQGLRTLSRLTRGPLSRGAPPPSPQLTGSQAGELHHLADRGRPKRLLSENLRPHAAGLPFSSPSPTPRPAFLPFQSPSSPSLPASSPSVILLIPPLVFPVCTGQSSHVIGHRHNSRLNCIHDAGPSSLFFFSMLSHARLPNAGWSLDSDESLRSEVQSHLASRPASEKCKPMSNKHTHSAWVFAHAFGTGLPSAVSTSSIHHPLFRPQSQDTIHTYCTTQYARIESPGLRNDTHNGNTKS